MDLKIFAERLRERRHTAGLTQAEIAEYLNIIPQTVSKWERALSLPDIDNLIKLAQLLDVTIDELVRYDEQLVHTFIAIDGGGTKTEFVAFSDNGHVIKHLLRGSTNPNVAGAEAAKNNLISGLNELLVSVRPSGVFLGVAGASTPGNSELLTKAIKSCVRDIPVRVCSDILNVIFSSPCVNKCIAAICGTGSSVFAWDGYELTRYGGWGYLFDGAGSGYDIGCDILRACFALNDGFGKSSIVTNLAQERLGGRAIDKLNEFYAGGRDVIASMAPCAFEAYRKGDEVAKRIIERNMKSLAELIQAAKKCSFNGLDTDIIIAGGLTNDRDVIEKCLRQHLGENQRIIFPDLPQIYGAAIAALKFFSNDFSAIDIEEFHKVFSEEYIIRKDLKNNETSNRNKKSTNKTY